MKHLEEVNRFGTIEYDKENKIVYMHFRGKVDAALGKEILQRTVEYTQNHTVHAVCGNLSELNGTFTMLNDYLLNTWYPSLIENGVFCNSMVVSKDAFTKFAANSLVQKMQSLTIRTFDSMPDATNWMCEMITQEVG